MAAEDNAENSEIERITVTTQKRAQPLQDVSVTVSVFNGETLELRGVQDLDVLSDITSGLVISNTCWTHFNSPTAQT